MEQVTSIFYNEFSTCILAIGVFSGNLLRRLFLQTAIKDSHMMNGKR